jgi:hypothetical protein
MGYVRSRQHRGVATAIAKPNPSVAQEREHEALGQRLRVGAGGAPRREVASNAACAMRQ